MTRDATARRGSRPADGRSVVRTLVVATFVSWGAEAHAGDTLALAVGSTTALELLPDLTGDVDARLRERVALTLDLPDHRQLAVDGAVRRLAFDDGRVVLDVHRLAVAAGHRAGPRIELGRTVKLDPRGLVPLDGLVVEGDLGEGARAQVFAGRLWHPELVLDGAALPSTWATGVGLTLRPPTADGPSRAIAVTAGWMGTLSDGVLTNSVAAGLSARGPRGATGSADLELRAPLDEEAQARAGAFATLPVGRALRVGPELRWEGLAPAGQIVGLRTPMDWLAGPGYGVVGGAAEADLGADIGVRVRGGAVVHERLGPQRTGGQARASIGVWPGEGPRIGLFGLGAAVGGSWVGGGGVELGLTHGGLRVSADSGWFLFQPIAGAPAPVSEARLRAGPGEVRVDDVGVDVAIELSAGSDRLLQRWVSGGITVGATLGGTP